MPADTSSPWRDEDTMRELYLDEQLSTYDIASELDCSPSTVRKWLQRHGIELRQNAGGPSGVSELHDENTLRELYVDDELSSTQIATRLGCDGSTVRKWLAKHDIERRSAAGGNTVGQLHNPDWLEHQYVNGDKTIGEIATNLDCARSTVKKWLDRHDIAVDERKNTTVDKLHDEDWLYDYYIMMGKTQAEIADKLDCSTDTVAKWVQRHGLQKW